MNKIDSERWRLKVAEKQVKWFTGYTDRQARRILKDFKK
jgi:hypothetical protein